MNNLSEEKRILFQEINRLELDKVKSLLGHNQYSFSDMVNYFSYSSIEPVIRLINFNLTSGQKQHIMLKEENLIYSLQSLIKEGFLFLIANDESFLKKCFKSDYGKIISADIFIDNSISNENLIFLYEKKLFSPKHLIHSFLDKKNLFKENNLNKEENTKYIQQLFRLDNILNHNDYYKTVDKVLLKDIICDRLIEDHYSNTITWNDILNSDINQFLKLTENDYKYLILNHPKHFERQCSDMQIQTLEKVLEHAPYFIGNDDEYLLEKISHSYKEENDVQSDDYYSFIHPDNLKILIEKTPTSLNRKITILKDLLEGINNSIYWHNYRERTDENFDFYTDGVKMAISDVEKKAIEKNFKTQENNRITKKRI